MDRAKAIELVRGYVKKDNNVKHMLAVGAVMRGLARRLGEDEEKWEVTGILHDIDFEVCGRMEDHAKIAASILSGKVSEEVIEAILAHNHENTGVLVDTAMKRALVASDAVSGLLVAAALVTPSKKLSEVKKESLVKKFRSKDFARGADRERIRVCEEIGLSVEDFLEIALTSLQEIAEEINL
ncbi:MAG: HD domain-containing protein [Candidatus Verstraetearchaeota archaeon]|nr:HD domain-containing protein [Candidatus Verstraetearchaeota archaeon]